MLDEDDLDYMACLFGLMGYWSIDCFAWNEI